MKTYLFPTIHPNHIKTIFGASGNSTLALTFRAYFTAQVRPFIKILDIGITLTGLVASFAGIRFDGWYIIGLLLRQNASLDALWQHLFCSPSPAMAVILLLLSPFTIHSIELGIDLYKIRDLSPWSFVKLAKTGLGLLF